MALRRSTHTALLAAGLLSCLACSGPRISQFEVKPQILCEGEKAVIRWAAHGELAMAIQFEPPQEAEPACAAEGLDTFALTLVARKRGEETERKVEIGQLHRTAAEPIVMNTNAIVGSDVVASGEKNSGLWGDRVEVATVAACRRRAIQVQHADKSASLPADGTPSDVLGGTALGGPWELRSPLSPEEQKNPSLRPKELKVLATVRCRPGKP
jgi:hypothetical protein